MLPEPLAWPLPGQRAACAIFMSPEVACNRFYFVIVLVALPFVFFMCRLLPSFLSLALLLGVPFLFLLQRVVIVVAAAAAVAHFWGK